MRIIAGNLKGRIIKAVPGKETRPTSDKIKEAIFHKLGPFFSGGICLDLFAGSGSLGIEAISRGMDHVIFIEKSKKALHTIQHNVQKLEIKNRCEVYHNDSFRALHTLGRKQRVFDLILVDPPYGKTSYKELLHTIETSNILREGGKIVVESDSQDVYDFNSASFSVCYQKKYSGTTSVMILERIANNTYK